jgi:hypothetical protein
VSKVAQTVDLSRSLSEEAIETFVTVELVEPKHVMLHEAAVTNQCRGEKVQRQVEIDYPASTDTVLGSEYPFWA